MSWRHTEITRAVCATIWFDHFACSLLQLVNKPSKWWTMQNRSTLMKLVIKNCLTRPSALCDTILLQLETRENKLNSKIHKQEENLTTEQLRTRMSNTFNKFHSIFWPTKPVACTQMIPIWSWHRTMPKYSTWAIPKANRYAAKHASLGSTTIKSEGVLDSQKTERCQRNANRHFEQEIRAVEEKFDSQNC